MLNACILVVAGCCGWLLLVAVAGYCCLLWLDVVSCCGFLSTECQPNIGEIHRFRARKYYLYMMICLYILQSLLLLCRVAVLLTLILTLCLRSSPLLQSQTANLVTLQSLTARPVPILRQNVMPILLISVITSTPRKTNNTSIIKREPPHQILVMIMGYILVNCSFCTGRIEPFNTVMMNITS